MKHSAVHRQTRPILMPMLRLRHGVRCKAFVGKMDGSDMTGIPLVPSGNLCTYQESLPRAKQRGNAGASGRTSELPWSPWHSTCVYMMGMGHQDNVMHSDGKSESLGRVCGALHNAQRVGIP